MNTVIKLATLASLLCAAPTFAATYCEGQGTRMHCTGVSSCDGIVLRNGAFCTAITSLELPKGTKLVDKSFFENLKNVKAETIKKGN